MNTYGIHVHSICLIIMLMSFNTETMFLAITKYQKYQNNLRTSIPSGTQDQYLMRLHSIEKNLPLNQLYIYEEKNACGVTVSREIAEQCTTIKNLSEDLSCKLIPVPYSATTIHNLFSILDKKNQKEIIIEKCSFNELVDILLLHEHLHGNSDYLKEKFNDITQSILNVYNTCIDNITIAITLDLTNSKNGCPSPYLFMINPAFTSQSIKENFIISLKKIAQFPNESEDFSSLKQLDQMWQKTKFYKTLKGSKIVLDVLIKQLEELETQHNNYLFSQKNNNLWNYLFEPSNNQ